MSVNAKPRWRTSISDASQESIRIRGYDVGDLAESAGFADVLYLLACGELPTPNQAKVLNALLISASDHSIVPSSCVTRTVASAGVPIQAAVAAGVLMFGDIHGGAGEQLALALHSSMASHSASCSEPEQAATRIGDEVLEQFSLAGQRIPGFGHPLHSSGDPRGHRLVRFAQGLGTTGLATAAILQIEDRLSAKAKRPIPLNVDGAIAGLALDIGIPPRMVRPLVFLGRTAGLSAHACEEYAREPGFRILADESEIEYDGPAPRSIPGIAP